jgi:hypothetical protein
VRNYFSFLFPNAAFVFHAFNLEFDKLSRVCCHVESSDIGSIIIYPSSAKSRPFLSLLLLLLFVAAAAAGLGDAGLACHGLLFVRAAAGIDHDSGRFQTARWVSKKVDR